MRMLACIRVFTNGYESLFHTSNTQDKGEKTDMRKKGWMTVLAGLACLTMTVSAFGAVELKRLLEAEDLDEYVTHGE